MGRSLAISFTFLLGCNNMAATSTRAGLANDNQAAAPAPSPSPDHGKTPVPTPRASPLPAADAPTVAVTLGLTPISPQTALDTVPLTFQLSAKNAGNSELSFSCSDPCPSGLQVNNAGVVTWQPQPQDLGPHSVTFVAQDGHGNLSSQTIAITVQSRFTTGMNAFVELGQPDFTSCAIDRGNPGVVPNGLSIPEGVSAHNGQLMVMDRGNNRLLTWSTLPTTSDVAPDKVWGQTDFVSAVSGTSATLLNFPRNVSFNGGELAISDDQNYRVLLFNTPPASPATPADYVLGEPDFTTRVFNAGNGNTPGPNTLRDNYMMSVYALTDRIVVSDRGNGRVLVFYPPYSTYMNASVVIGQPTFTTFFDATGTPSGPTATASTLGYPGKAWSDGTRLLVADVPNNRVLLWNTFPTTNGAPADVVLGQPDMTSAAVNRGGNAAADTLSGPVGVVSDGTRIFIADVGNHRILVFNAFPTANGAAADAVIGQPDFSSVAQNCTQSGLNTPADLAWDGKTLYVADQGSGNRILFYGP